MPSSRSVLRDETRARAVVSVVAAEVREVAAAVEQWAAFKVRRQPQAPLPCCTACLLCALHGGAPSVHYRSKLDHWWRLNQVKPGAISVSFRAAPPTSSPAALT